MDTEYVILFRNRIELPIQYVDYDSSMTLEKLRFYLEGLSWCDKTMNFRFRRFEIRKNGTHRPSLLYNEEEMKLPFSKLLDVKKIIYIEESSDFYFDGLNDPNRWDSIFITIRKWDYSKKKPISIRDCWISSSWTLLRLKEYLSSFITIPLKEMFIFEEIRYDDFQPMLIDKQLYEYKIETGAIIYIEQIDKEQYIRLNICLSQEYYLQNEKIQSEQNFDKIIAKHIKNTTPIHNLSELPGSISSECKCCYISKIDSVFMPCAHMAFCHDCAKKTNDVCPICRKKLEKVIKVYVC